MHRVGIVNMNLQSDLIISGFKEGLAQRGYIEGENIKYIYPGPIKNLDHAKQLLNKLVSEKVDLIYTITTPATKAAMKITEGSNIPLLFGPVMAPVASGIVPALHHQDNRITGVQVRGSTEKTLAYLIEILPNLKNIYVLFNSDSGPSKISLKDLKKAAKILGVNILAKNVHNKEELMTSLGQTPSETGAIWIPPSRLIIANIEAIISTANKLKIPTVSPVGQVHNGPIVTYSPKHAELGKQISRLADKLLRGIKPSSLPIETAEFFLGINIKTADVLGIDIPKHLLNQADFIIRESDQDRPHDSS